MTDAPDEPRPRNRIGFDCEAHRFIRGRNASRMVCLSLYGRGQPPHCVSAVHREDMRRWALVRPTAASWSALLTGTVAVEVFRALIEYNGIELVAHKSPFDLAVMAVAANTRPGSAGTIMPAIFAALDDGRIRDTIVREQLLAIANDRVGFDPVTGGKMSYSLAHLMQRYFEINRSGDKGEAETCQACNGSGWQHAANAQRQCTACDGFGLVGPWQLRYHQLDGVPVNEWPEEAVDYALDDARDALLVFEAQAAPQETTAGVLVDADGTVTDEIDQTRDFFALHLTSCHGPRTDKHAVEVLAESIEGQVIAGRIAAIEAGFMRDATGFAKLDPKTVPCKAHRDATGKRQSKRNPFPDEECVLCQGTGERRKKGKPFSLCVSALRNLVAEAYDDGDGVPEDIITKPNKEGKGGGNISYSTDTLQGSGDPALIAYADGSEYRTLAERYIPLLRLGVDRPLTSSMGFILKSGRASGRDPSLQTGPRKGDYRSCFLARPGRAYIATDYHLAELCSLAQIHLWMGLGDTMAAALHADEDLHLRLGAKLGGVDYATAFEAYHDPSHPLHVDFTRPKNGHRQLAKVGNFGFPGGLGAPTFVSYARKQGVELAATREEAIEIAARIRALWFDEWPEMQGYFDIISNGTMWGPTTIRQFVSGRIRGGVGFCDGCNTLFQGLTADGAKRAMYEVQRACHGADPVRGKDSALYRYNCRPWNFIHDEIIIEAPDETVDDGWALTQCGDELTTIMVDAMQQYLPDVPVRASPAASKRWSKKADELRDDEGRLLLWSKEQAS